MPTAAALRLDLESRLDALSSPDPSDPTWQPVIVLSDVRGELGDVLHRGDITLARICLSDDPRDAHAAYALVYSYRSRRYHMCHPQHIRVAPLTDDDAWLLFTQQLRLAR